MLYFLQRGTHAITCETRLNPEAAGYQLVITEGSATRVETFERLPALLSREHELLQTWRSLGWSVRGGPPRAPQRHPRRAPSSNTAPAVRTSRLVDRLKDAK